MAIPTGRYENFAIFWCQPSATWEVVESDGAVARRSSGTVWWYQISMDYASCKSRDSDKYKCAACAALMAHRDIPQLASSMDVSGK